MAHKISLSRRAVADLDSIKAWSIDRFGQTVADAYLQNLQRGMAFFADNPQAGQRHRGRANVRAYACKSHRIYYELTEDAIFVARILHQAMDSRRHLGTR